jgi:hypothetical protein
MAGHAVLGLGQISTRICLGLTGHQDTSSSHHGNINSFHSLAPLFRLVDKSVLDDKTLFHRLQTG